MDDTTQEQDAAPTVAESPSARAETVDTRAGLDETLPQLGSGSAPSSAPSVPGSPATTIQTPLDALRLDEMRRSRSLAAAAVTMCPLAALMLPFLGGDELALWFALGGLALVFFSNVYLLRVAKPERYTEWRVGIVWLIATLGLLPLLYYFGVLSGAVAVLVLGMYFIGQGHSAQIARLVYGTGAAGHLAMGVAILTNVMPDVGILGSNNLTSLQQTIAIGLVQLIFLAVYALARVSRSTMLRSVEELQDAVKGIAQREALLEEARQDFARAMRIGDAGRFTGATLGSYKLGHVIGRGAMGEVYLGEHTGSKDQAAVKVLLSGAAIQPGSLARFLRETKIASAIESPHVVKVLEVGDRSADIPYLAMELLDGSDLATLLRQAGRLDVDAVVELIAQVGAGLRAATDAGIVHRDIKPQNLFQVRDAKLWKILDFGVSKIAGGSGTLTQGAVIGTPGYMAPEQASGVEVDERADLYSLGAIAYRCLTGRPPFSGRDVAPILYKVVNEMPPAPSAVADVNRDFDYVLAIAMAKAPNDRFASADELARAIADAGRGRVTTVVQSKAEALWRRHPWRETIRGAL